jgi:hypothetical protein
VRNDVFDQRLAAEDVDGAFQEAWALGYEEATVDLTHPEFGTIWGPDGECRKEYERGVLEATRRIAYMFQVDEGFGTEDIVMEGIFAARPGASTEELRQEAATLLKEWFSRKKKTLLDELEDTY